MSPEKAADDRPRGARPAARWVEIAAITLAIYLGYQLLVIAWSLVHGLLVVVLLFVFGMLLAYLLMPAVDRLERYGASRTVGILLIYVVAFGLLGISISLLAGPLAQQVAAAVNQAPRYVDEAQRWLQRVDAALDRPGLQLNLSQEFASRAKALLNSGFVEGLLGAVLKGARTALESLVYLVIVLVIAFWVAKDGRRMRDGLVQSLPVRYRDRALFVLEATGMVIGGYVRAQLLLALIIGIMAAAGTWVLGVHFPLVIGLAAGIFELIPMVGAFAGGVVGVGIAIFQSPRLALLTAAWFLLIHIVEGYILAPRVTARFVRLHPLVTFLALLVGIQTAGFLGAFFAVPLASVLNVMLQALYRDYKAREPEEFTGPAPRARIWRAALTPFARQGPGALARLKALALRHAPWLQLLGLLLLGALAVAIPSLLATTGFALPGR